MNCYLHPDLPATAFCRDCGRALCVECQRPFNGTIFCKDHVPVVDTSIPPSNAAANPYLQPAVPVNNSPGLAFVLGLIPGVGAIYNGQYLKGLVHAIIFGVLVSLLHEADSSSGWFLGIITFGFYAYMAFEAYHTAKSRRSGQFVEEWSSLVAPNRYMTRAPIGPVLLIGLGVLFLLDTLRVIEFRELARFWPVLLIVVGSVMLYNRVTGPQRPAAPSPLESVRMESGREQ